MDGRPNTHQLVSKLLKSRKVEDSLDEYVRALTNGGTGNPIRNLSDVEAEVIKTKLLNKTDDPVGVTATLSALSNKHGAIGEQFSNLVSKLVDDKPLLVIVRSSKALTRSSSFSAHSSKAPTDDAYDNSVPSPTPSRTSTTITSPIPTTTTTATGTATTTPSRSRVPFSEATSTFTSNTTNTSFDSNSSNVRPSSASFTPSRPQQPQPQQLQQPQPQQLQQPQQQIHHSSVSRRPSTPPPLTTPPRTTTTTSSSTNNSYNIDSTNTSTTSTTATAATANNNVNNVIANTLSPLRQSLGSNDQDSRIRASQISASLSAVKDPEWMSRQFQSFVIEPRRNINVHQTTETLDFRGGQLASGGAVATLSVEARLVEDLLFAMAGLQGHVIRVTLDSAPYVTLFPSHAETIDVSLRELVMRMIPLCNHFIAVRRFCAEASMYKSGMVCQALGAAIRHVIKEYLVLVAQLEHQFLLGSLTLSRMWYHVQPSVVAMATLDTLVKQIDKRNLELGRAGKAQCRGGELVGVIHGYGCAVAGDKQASSLMGFLLQKAAVPFFEILDQWARCGNLTDPYQEFFVEENPSAQSHDTFWNQRYTLRQEQCPEFLQRVMTKVLNCGKHLNVIRACGKSVNTDHMPPIKYTDNDREVVDTIDKAHRFNSQELLKLFFQEHSFKQHLRSLKHYFLLDSGDFFGTFMDLAETELMKPVPEISMIKLQSLLDLSIRSSSATAEDQYKDDVGCVLLSHDLTTQLLQIIGVTSGENVVLPATQQISGLRGFTLTLQVTWPITLVLTTTVLAKFQILFRHIFHIKQVSRQMTRAWVMFQSVREYNVGPALTSLFLLLQRILHFIQNLQYHVAVEVVEPRWRIFVSKLDQAATLEDVILSLNEFLDRSINECMLAESQLLKPMHKLLTLCVIFADFVKQLTDKLDKAARPLILGLGYDTQDPARQGFRTRRSARIQAVSEQARSILHEVSPVIAKYHDEFYKVMVGLMMRLTERTRADPHLMNLLHRLDYNGFYARMADSKSASKQQQMMQ